MSASSRPASSRPLSPHLQIYRPQITSVLSILHRISGIILSVGLLYLVLWLVFAAAGPASYGKFMAFHNSWFGRLILFGWSLSLFYHLCSGVRHLCWDAGWGFDLKRVSTSGWLVIAATIGLTLLSWILGYAFR